MTHAEPGIDQEVTFFVLVKSHNHRQDAAGARTLLNYHWFAEIFVPPGRRPESARLYRPEAEGVSWSFRPHNDDVLGDNAWYVEGGWFPDETTVDAALPNGVYAFDIETARGAIRSATVRLTGTDGASEIPEAPAIVLQQRGKPAPPDRIDPDIDTIVTWGDYAGGKSDPHGIIDDMVFVVVADCFGRRIVKSGLCFEEACLTYRDTSYTIPAGTLRPGRPHSMFVELPQVADSIVAAGVPGFACFASATYLDLHTLGRPTGDPCPEGKLAMDTGETDRLRPSRPEELRALTTFLGER